MVEQVDHFFERDFAGEFVDVVTAINEAAGLALDVAEPCLRGDNAFKAFGGSGGNWSGHASIKHFCTDKITGFPGKNREQI